MLIASDALDAEAVAEAIAAVAGGAGTVPELAASVAAFLAKPGAAAVKAAEVIVSKLPAHEQPTGAYYTKVMSKSVAKGADFPKTEAARLLRMMEAGPHTRPLSMLNSQQSCPYARSMYPSHTF